MAEKIEDGAPTIEKLNEQIGNLNKGIAEYRDKVNASEKVSEAAKTEASAAKAEVERLTKLIEEAAGPDEKKAPQLNPKDQERLEAWAKEQGFVTKKEMDDEKARMFNESIRSVEATAIAEFLESHPEYDNKEKWDGLQKEFAQYRQPTSITGYRQILAKIHKELKGTDDAAARARVEVENRKRLGLGGGPTGGAEDDTTLEDLMERYPNLNREQIEARLEEINQISSDRAKKIKARQK